MQRGISPIVAVVLLIAISVIAATGIWFWIGGLASKQSTVTAPIIINAQSINCTTATGSVPFNVSVMVQNLDASRDLALPLYLIADNGTCANESAVSIPAQTQAKVTFNCTVPVIGVTRGGSYTLYTTGSGSASITFTC